MCFVTKKRLQTESLYIWGLPKRWTVHKTLYFKIYGALKNQPFYSVNYDRYGYKDTERNLFRQLKAVLRVVYTIWQLLSLYRLT